MEIRKENGAVMVVEATIVFPIMFFVIFLIILYGNVMYQKSKIDNYVSTYAQWGAQQCADPLYLKTLKKGSIVSDSSEVDVKPYRYFGNMGDIITQVESKVMTKSKGTGFFTGMQPKGMVVDAKFSNFVVYSTFDVQAKYHIDLPITLLGQEIKLSTLSSYDSVPVSDSAEFVNNINMAKNYVESNQKIQKAIQKVKDFLN
ncbi:MAG: TadE/TadG family type IV pilus assembly protein [Eubacterium sp.]